MSLDPAFPTVGINKNDGLTKREYAAIHIFAAFRANPNIDLNYDANKLIKWSIEDADELLRQTNKEKL